MKLLKDWGLCKMIKDEVVKVTIDTETIHELLEKIDKYKRSLEKIERYTYFEHHGLEFIRDEVLYVLDKL